MVSTLGDGFPLERTLGLSGGEPRRMVLQRTKGGRMAECEVCQGVRRDFCWSCTWRRGNVTSDGSSACYTAPTELERATSDIAMAIQILQVALEQIDHRNAVGHGHQGFADGLLVELGDAKKRINRAMKGCTDV